MKENDDMLKERAWTPYREVMRYKRLLMLSVLVNLILAAALLRCLR
jgi:hypothetical protein